MRYLAIDPGAKRAGLAVGDDRTRVATPLAVIDASSLPQLLEHLGRAIERHGPDALVVGLPLNMDGSEGPAAQSARAFGATLQQHFGLPVHFFDERLTTFAAEEAMAGSDLTRRGRKRRRDALAAAVLLGDYLARHGPGPGRPPSDAPTPA